jgi:hypothetical protein
VSIFEQSAGFRATLATVRIDAEAPRVASQRRARLELIEPRPLSTGCVLLFYRPRR